MTSFPPDSGPAATPPVLPPKPGSHEASGISTPTPYGSSATPGSFNTNLQSGMPMQGQPSGQVPSAAFATEQQVPPIPEDPGEHWLPHILEDKSYVSNPPRQYSDTQEERILTSRQKTRPRRHPLRPQTPPCPHSLPLNRPSLNHPLNGPPP